ncbi:MAG: CD3072 family TudS-related putative desulfidase [Bacillota bacterium]|jgi:predicted secreted protein
MFDDGRSKKIVFIAHCFLNQNSISDGTAVCPAAFKEVSDFFLNADIGIVQMPCPEFCCLGLDRGNIHGAESLAVVENTRIRTEMKKDSSNTKLTKLADYVVQQILEYDKYGFEIVGIIGANRSPNCGVDTTSDNNEEISGMGLFIEEIFHQLSRENISIPMIGLKGNNNIIEKLQQLL